MAEIDRSEGRAPRNHPLFARMYARMAADFEAKGAREHRTEALAGLAGRVVELGRGPVSTSATTRPR